MTEYFVFKRALAAHLRNWPKDWQAVFFHEILHRKSAVDIQVFLVHNGEELRTDYTISLDRFDNQPGDWDETDAAIMANDTREFIELCLFERRSK